MSYILDAANGCLNTDLPYNCFYLSKNLKTIYINSGAPSAKHEENTYKVYVDFVTRVEKGDIFKFSDRPIYVVVNGDRQTRLEVPQYSQISKDLLNEISKLFEQKKEQRTGLFASLVGYLCKSRRQK